MTDLTTHDISDSVTYLTSTESNDDEIRWNIPLSVLLVLLLFVGIVGNSLVIYVVLRYERMRTPTNMLLLYLAAIDLLVLIGFFVHRIVVNLGVTDSKEEFPFCRPVAMLAAFCTGATSFTLLAVSVVRYIVIVHPQLAKSVITLRRVNMLIGVISLFAVATLTWTHYFIPCRYTKHTRGVKIFMYNYLALCYVIPLSLITVFSVMTFRVLRKPSLATNKKSDDNKRRASRMVLIVCAAFAICLFPYFLITVVPAYRLVSASTFNIFEFISAFFSLGNSCINPIIYSFTSNDFRARFYAALCCCFPRKASFSRESHSKQVRKECTHDNQVSSHTNLAMTHNDEQDASPNPVPATVY